MGGPQNMQSMIKQAQKMQEEMEKTQEELSRQEYTTSAGGRHGQSAPSAARRSFP